ncbi:Magnetosome formation protease MamE [Azospirillaceae bacterium]|nr:magnetosome formation protease MamE [uncultured bacterium]
MKSDDLDIDIDAPAVGEYPQDCARGLRKYLFVMAVIVVGTLAGTFWYRTQAGAEATPVRLHGPALAAAPAINNASPPAGSPLPAPPLPPSMRSPAAAPAVPSAVLAAMTAGAADFASPNFAAIVANLRGSVVSVGRSRPEGRFGFGRGTPAAADPAQQAAQQAQMQTGALPPDAPLQFAAPVAAAVLESIGTGFIVRNDGYILTNYHVVRGNDAMVVTVFDEVGAQRYPANIIKLDASVDLALLKIEPRAPLVTTLLGDSDQVQVADEVIAIGSPFGLDLTVSRGIVSAKRKSLVIEGTVHRDLLQTDAAINQGNSGGPLVNRMGEVIGINTAIYTPTGAFAGVGFAVPSNQAKLFLAEELTTIPGSAVAGLPVAMAPGAAGPAGPPILAGVAPPHRDGREAMDCAICHQLIPRPGTAPQSRPVAGNGSGNSAMAWPVAIPGGTANRAATAGPPILAGAAPPHRDGRETMDCAICHTFIPRTAGAAPVAQTGATASGLQFARPPTTLALNVAVPPGQPPGLPAATPTPDGTVGGFLIQGATTLPVTAALAQQTGQPQGKGVFVAGVAPASPAAEAGLQPGTIIEKVNGKRIRTPRELFTMTQDAAPGDSLRLAIIQGNARREVRLKVEAAGPPAPGVNGSGMGGLGMGIPAMGVPGAPVPPMAKAPTEFNWRGMEIETFVPVVAPGTQGQVQLKGASIAEVVPTSPAQRAGVQANDVILEINGMPTSSAAKMNQAIQAATGKRDIMMKMARNNREFFVVLP